MVRFYVWVLTISLCLFGNIQYCFATCRFKIATETVDAHFECNKPTKDIKTLTMSILYLRVPELNASLLLPFKQVTSISLYYTGPLVVKSDAFKNLRLEKLTIVGSKIETLDEETLQNQVNLTEVDLGYNKIITIRDKLFEKTTSLQKLKLQGNSIKIIEGQAFNNLEHLKLLNLSVNNIEMLPEEIFKNLDSLEVLDLHSNYLSFLSRNTFINLNYLKALDLNYNNFKIFHDKIFHDLGALETLDLSHNQIVHLQEALFYKINKLKVLKINNNNIVDFHYVVNLVYQPELVEIHLYDNLWRCESLRKLVKDMAAKKIKIIIPNPVKTKPNVDGISCLDILK